MHKCNLYPKKFSNIELSRLYLADRPFRRFTSNGARFIET